MKTRRLSRLAIGALAVFAIAGAGPVLAQHGGGGGGGSHGGGGGFHGGGGSFHSGGAFHGGVSRFHGAGGFRGGGYAGRGRGYGYGWGGGYRGYGWYGGAGLLGYGLFFAALPFAYDTYWWDGVPYYYADDNYYIWDGPANEYETVQPPPAVVDQATAAGQADSPTELFAYPMNGQSATQQAKDRTDCQQWAGAQAKAQSANHHDYLRAESACLTAKGYSVR
jgi:hypothetical protein